MLATVMCRKCGSLDISQDDEQDVRCGSSVGYFAKKSYRGLPVVREVDQFRRVYHGPESLGCSCDPLMTIRVYLE